MSLTEGIDKFHQETLQKHEKLAQENATKFLVDLFPEDYKKIKKYSFNSSEGKFYGMDAPEEILSQLRDADILIEG